MADKLTRPQRELLAEIKESGVLYITWGSRWQLTASALARRGLAHIVEHDYSRLRQDGWAIKEVEDTDA